MSVFFYQPCGMAAQRRHRGREGYTGELYATIREYIRENNGSCEVDISPFAVFLNENDKAYVEPDISVICDRNKLNDKGCIGAPDWIIEVVSPGSKRMDYYTKLSLYKAAGVHEYWIVDPSKHTTIVYDMEHDDGPALHSFSESVNVNIYPGFSINLSKLNL